MLYCVHKVCNIVMIKHTEVSFKKLMFIFFQNWINLSTCSGKGCGKCLDGFCNSCTANKSGITIFNRNLHLIWLIKFCN